MIGQSDLKTAETSPRASFGDEMPDGGPDLGCDGLGLDVEQLRLGNGRLLLIGGQQRSISLVGFSRVDLEGSCSRSFDHGQSSYNAAIDVLNLAAAAASAFCQRLE